MCKWFDGTASLAPSESQIGLIDRLAPFYTDSKKSLHPALLPDKAFKSSWLRVNAEWHSTSFLLFQNELMDDLWDGNTQTSSQGLGNSFSVGLFLLIKIISSRERERKRESTALRKKITVVKPTLGSRDAKSSHSGRWTHKCQRGNKANNGTITAMAGMCMARMACPWYILCPVRRLGPETELVAVLNA